MQAKRSRVPVWAKHRTHSIQKMFSKAERFWEARATGAVLILASIAIFVYWQFNVPSPGKAVAALAVTAAVMTMRAEMNGVEKFFWMGVLFAFLFVEVRSIDKDRADNAEKDRVARKKLDIDFAGVLTQNQKAFDETIMKMNNLANLSTENLYQMTGGDSWCYFAPVPNMSQGNPPTYPLLLYVQGKHAMQGVTARLQTIGTVTPEQIASGEIDRYIPLPQNGTLLPGVQPISTSFRVPLGTTSISISSRNGYVGELLVLKIVNGNLLRHVTVERSGPWGHKMVLDKIY